MDLGKLKHSESCGPSVKEKRIFCKRPLGYSEAPAEGYRTPEKVVFPRKCFLTILDLGAPKGVCLILPTKTKIHRKKPIILVCL